MILTVWITWPRLDAARWARRLILAWVMVSLLALLGACGPLAGKVAGAALGGPDVMANVQAGQSNAQVLGTAQIANQRLVRPQARSIEQSAGETAVRSEAIQTLVVRQDVPPWVWLLAILGWLAPSPGEIGSAIAAIFKRNGRGNDAHGKPARNT